MGLACKLIHTKSWGILDTPSALGPLQEILQLQGFAWLQSDGQVIAYTFKVKKGMDKPVRC